MKKFIVALGVLAVGALVFWPGSGREWIDLDVPEGATAHHVARDLKAQGALMIPQPFVAWVKIRGAENKIKVGRYRISKGRSAYWIVDDIVGGRTVKTRLVIPEGFASWQIAERLQETGVCSGDAFLAIVRKKELEGFLFPATYDVDLGLSANTMADYLVSSFHENWSSDMTERARALGFTQREIVTLASIIEREAVVPDERALISSVYHNRLKKKMRLQADPTVQYALGYWKERLLFSDLSNTKSPYNTYLYAGLPPGPICSPGRMAIQAALNPAQSEYLYFVASGEGRHTFSTTYKDHSSNVHQRNQRRRAERAKKK